MMDTRGRLTLVDVVFVVADIAFLAVMLRVFYPVLQEHGGSLATGEGYLWQLIPPLLVLVLLATIWVTAISGSGTR